jgi:POT family proton-dependent oligopeptide transporter
MSAAAGTNIQEPAMVQNPKGLAEDVKSEKDVSLNVSSLPDDDSGEDPTEEELKTLTRVSGKIPWTAYTIAFVELCERFGYYGCQVLC